VVVEIDTLALSGVPAMHRHRVVAAFRRELTRLLHGDGAADLPAGAPLAAARDRGYDELTGPAALPATGSPRLLGEALARAVHRSLGEGS
jgi:hypothetical protein